MLVDSPPEPRAATAPAPPTRRAVRPLGLLLSVVLLALVAVASIAIGAKALTLAQVWHGLFHGSGTYGDVVVDERLARTVLGLLAGAALGLLLPAAAGLLGGPGGGKKNKKGGKKKKGSKSGNPMKREAEEKALRDKLAGKSSGGNGGSAFAKKPQNPALPAGLQDLMNEAGDNGTPDLPPNLGGGVAGLFGR